MHLLYNVLFSFYDGTNSMHYFQKDASRKRFTCGTYAERRSNKNFKDSVWNQTSFVHTQAWCRCKTSESSSPPFLHNTFPLTLTLINFVDSHFAVLYFPVAFIFPLSSYTTYIIVAHGEHSCRERNEKTKEKTYTKERSALKHWRAAWPTINILLDMVRFDSFNIIFNGLLYKSNFKTKG